MTFDKDRIDDAVLALLYLGLHDQYRAWKGFDWDAMNRLYDKGFISDPIGKANQSFSPTKDYAVQKSFSGKCSLSKPAQPFRSKTRPATRSFLRYRPYRARAGSDAA